MSPLQQTYQGLYESLTELREHLHLAGRIDDSNAKLDEVSKVLALCIAEHNSWIDSNEFNELINTQKHDSTAIDVLNRSFELCVDVSQFKNDDGSSIFGVSPKLNMHENDHEYALKLARTIYSAFSRSVSHSSDNNTFDFVNEAFGHFVRDNFRGNIEDAQYMTPPEVVDFICDWAISELTLEGFDFSKKSLTVLDPSCGVGSFLASFYRKLGIYLGRKPRKIKLIGQDKVDRMVRLSKINMMLFGSDVYDISQGNSLFNSERLNKLNGKVDLIITNPPFGANIPYEKLYSEPADNYPLFHESRLISNSIDSELAFIDRELALLKEGGRLFIVVPDSTISSRGISETLRQRLLGIAEVKGVVELPSVTFAQAGTRTKTSILYIRKGKAINNNGLTIMSTIQDLGFQVSMRKGVAVKKYEGINELEMLSKNLAFKKVKEGIIIDTPSCTAVSSNIVESGSWTASHYSAKRVNAIRLLEDNPECTVEALGSLVSFETKKRRRLKEEDGSKCISVLHVIGDGIIDFNELHCYQPKTRGNVCYEGDILFSKINPRIPRVIIVPKLDFPTTCSNEFEILRARDGVDPYWILYMLLEGEIQDQIQSLTSGTSSSHNRIKTSELEIVRIPIPKSKAKIKEMEDIVLEYRNCLRSLTNSLLAIHYLRSQQV